MNIVMRLVCCVLGVVVWLLWHVVTLKDGE